MNGSKDESSVANVFAAGTAVAMAGMFPLLS